MSPRVKPFMWKWVWFTWKWTCRGNSFYILWFHMKTCFGAEAKSNWPTVPQKTTAILLMNYIWELPEVLHDHLWQSLLQFIFVTSIVVYWLCGILWCARWWREGMKIPHLTQTRLNVSYMDLYIVLKTAAMQTNQWSLLTSVYHLDRELYTPTCNIDFLHNSPQQPP